MQTFNSFQELKTSNTYASQTGTSNLDKQSEELRDRVLLRGQVQQCLRTIEDVDEKLYADSTKGGSQELAHFSDAARQAIRKLQNEFEKVYPKKQEPFTSG